MRHISFRVEGNLPPKKDGASSMWKKEAEAHRLVALRLQALEAMGNKPPFSQDIRLKVSIHLGSSNTRATGDLDNFVSGICDGLMKADRCAKLHRVFCKLENAAIHPRKTSAIHDDYQIVEIHAIKFTGESGDDWYEVELSGK